MNPGKRRKFIKRGIMDQYGNFVEKQTEEVEVLPEVVQEVEQKVEEQVVQEVVDEVKPKVKKVKKVVDSE